MKAGHLRKAQMRIESFSKLSIGRQTTQKKYPHWIVQSYFQAMKLIILGKLWNVGPLLCVYLCHSVKQRR